MSEETKEEVVPETNEEVVAETAEGTQAAVQSPYKGFFGKVDNFFGITKAKSNFKAEIVAGLTTFMAMVYILIVNPSLFSNIPGVSFQGMYIATSVGAIIGTLLMALLAKMPLAQASGMGVNAFVVFNLVLGGGLSYPNAMVFTLLDGVIFIILTATGLRKYIFTAIPDEVKKAITVGLGMFIAFIGLQNASVVIDNSSTLVQLVSLNVLVSNLVTYSAGTVGAMLPAFVALAGVIAIAVLSHYKVKGAILWGILGSTVLFYALAGIGCLIPGADLITYTAPVASESAPLFLDESLSSYLSTNWNAITGVYDYTLTNVPKEAFEAVFGNLAETELPVSHFFTNGEACKAIFTNIAFSNPLAAFSAWGVESAGKVFYEGFDFSGAYSSIDNLGAFALHARYVRYAGHALRRMLEGRTSRRRGQPLEYEQMYAFRRHSNVLRRNCGNFHRNHLCRVVGRRGGRRQNGLYLTCNRAFVPFGNVLKPLGAVNPLGGNGNRAYLGRRAYDEFRNGYRVDKSSCGASRIPYHCGNGVRL